MKIHRSWVVAFAILWPPGQGIASVSPSPEWGTEVSMVRYRCFHREYINEAAEISQGQGLSAAVWYLDSLVEIQRCFKRVVLEFDRELRECQRRADCYKIDYDDSFVVYPGFYYD